MTIDSTSSEFPGASRSWLQRMSIHRLGTLFQNPDWLITLTGFALVLLAALIRLIDINRGLWLDELHTSWAVSGYFTEVASRAAAGNQSPLYFFVLWPWVALFGQSELSLRWISVLSGTLITFAVWRIVAILSRSKWAGIFAAGLVAIDPFFIEYSQEARPYALLQLIGLLQIYFFFNLIVKDFPEVEKPATVNLKAVADHSTNADPVGRSPSETETSKRSRQADRIGLIACALVGFYLHLTAMLLTIAMLLIYATRLVWGGEAITRTHSWRFFDFGIVLIGCLPMWPILTAVSGRRANWELFVNDSTQTASIGFQLTGYMVPGLVIAGLLCFCRRPTRSNSDLMVLAMCYLIPILLAWMALKTGLAALYHHRYFMMGWTGAILMLTVAWGRLMETQTKWIRWVGGISVILVFSLSVGNNDLIKSAIQEKKLRMPFESPWNAAVKQANQQIQAYSSNQQTIVYLFPNLIEDRYLVPDPEIQADLSIQRYCLFPVRGIYSLATERAFAKSTLFRPRFSQQDVAELQDAKSVILMIRGNEPIQSDILNEFAKFGFQHDLFFVIKWHQAFPVRGAPGNFISVYQFEIGPPEPGSAN